MLAAPTVALQSLLWLLGSLSKSGLDEDAHSPPPPPPKINAADYQTEFKKSTGIVTKAPGQCV